MALVVPASRLIDVERLIRRAAGALAEDLAVYWPSAGRNELPEANVTLHLAATLREAGFAVFAEAHSAGTGTERRHDLLALRCGDGTLIACEAKRLYNGQQAQRMRQDAQRLKEFAPLEGEDHLAPGVELMDRIGVLAATTWNEGYARWFAGEDAADVSDEALDPIWEALLKHATRWGACPLQDDWTTGARRTQWLVFAAIPLPPRPA